MSAAVSGAVDRAHQAWSRAIAAESARAARAALEAQTPGLIAARAAAIVAANVDAAGREGVRLVDQALAAAGRDPIGLAVDLAPSIDVVESVMRAWRRARAAAPEGQPFHAGLMRTELARIIGDTLTDAWREGQAAAMDADDEITGYRRVARPGCCGMCLALVNGQILPVSEPLEKHGRCRCTMEPVIAGVNDGAWARPTGQERWDAMTPADQDAMFFGHGGRAKAELIRSGAVALEQLVASVPRPDDRPLHREATLAELAAR